MAKRVEPELLVGLGGGSSMDCAKGINFVYTNGGTMHDYHGVGQATAPMLPMIAVPTTAGTGSEMQSFALISDAKTHVKMACGDKKASCRIAILDPQLTLTQPENVTASDRHRRDFSCFGNLCDAPSKSRSRCCIPGKPGGCCQAISNES